MRTSSVRLLPIVAVLVALVLLALVPFVANALTDYLPKGASNARVDEVAYVDVESSVVESSVVDPPRLCAAFDLGDRKDPSRNFRTSSCVKLDHPGIARACPELLSAFFTPDFARRCAKAAGVPRLALNSPSVDVNCVFLRRYVAGDFLAPHYDNNFSVGRRFTAVVPLLVNDANTSEFLMYDDRGRMHVVPIPLGKAVVYDGWRVRHAITAQRGAGERVVLVLHLYTDPRMDWFGAWRKWARDLTYRALSL